MLTKDVRISAVINSNPSLLNTLTKIPAIQGNDIKEMFLSKTGFINDNDLAIMAPNNTGRNSIITCIKFSLELEVGKLINSTNNQIAYLSYKR